jgi:hypothetical protein
MIQQDSNVLLYRTHRNRQTAPLEVRKMFRQGMEYSSVQTWPLGDLRNIPADKENMHWIFRAP